MAIAPKPVPVDPCKKLEAGEALIFAEFPKDRAETAEEKALRTVLVEWLERLVAAHTRVVTKPVTISHGIIAGPLNFQHAVLECAISFVDCTFTGKADFSFASFKRPVSFEDCKFLDTVTFRAATFVADLCVARASFAKNTIFQDVQIGHNLDACGIQLSEASFERIIVAKGVIFRPDLQGRAATFWGATSFRDANITGVADFERAQFLGATDFNRMQVFGPIFFRIPFSSCEPTAQDNEKAPIKLDAELPKPTSFKGTVNFRNAKITGNAEFDGVSFEKEATFEGMQVGGSLYIRPDLGGRVASFSDNATFNNSVVSGDFEFIGSQCAKEAIFERMKVERSALFHPGSDGKRTVFSGSVNFHSAAFGSKTDFFKADFRSTSTFENVHFQGPVRFIEADFAVNKEAKFIGSRFEHGVYFNSATFRGSTDFTSAVAERDSHFSGARFEEPVSFREARFCSVFFDDPANSQNGLRRKAHAASAETTTFSGGIDLRGFTYERIYVALEPLFPKLTPFDRHPYSQLEGAFMKTGDDDRARLVYLERRKQERKRKCRLRTIHFWLLDWLYKLFANYGVRPFFRIIACALLLIGVGTAIFSRPGALAEKEGNAAAKLQECASGGFGRGFGASFHYFLPWESPVGADCIPAVGTVSMAVPLSGGKAIPMRPDWYAALLRILGTTLQAVGLAASTGLLRRIAR